MSYPTTPPSILVRLKHEVHPASWNRSWEEFFDLYHEAVRVSVMYSFSKFSWYRYNDEDLEATVLKVFQSFNDEIQKGFEFDGDRGKFRQFLITICQRRVSDFMRQQKRLERFDSLAPEELAEATRERNIEIFDEQEKEKVNEEFAKAKFGELLSLLRERVAPRVYTIFELVKLNGGEPENVAQQLEVKRGVVDNSIYKAMQTLRAIHEELGSKKQQS